MTSETRRYGWLKPAGDIGRRQRGLIMAWQLSALGLTRSGRCRAVAAGVLKPVRNGVFLLPGVKPNWETYIAAAALAAGEGAVASHLTAGRIWRLFDGGEPPDAAASVHLTAPGLHRLGGVTVHRQQLLQVERCQCDGVPVTTVARTLFDLASVLDIESLDRCLDEAIRRKIVKLSQVAQMVERNAGGGRRRIAPLREVLSHRSASDRLGANPWELGMDRLWDELGLPPAERQYWTVAEGRNYCLDRAILDIRLAVEWVGHDHHDLNGRYRRDRRRTSDLVLAGWDVIEVAPDWTPDRIRRTVLAKVAERRRLAATD